MFIVVSSCGQLPSTKLKGEWKPVEITVNAKDIKPELVKKTEEIELSNTYIFKKDGQFVINNSKDNYFGSKGEWYYSIDNKVLILKIGESKVKEIEVVKHTRKHLWLKHNWPHERYAIIKLERK